VAFEDSVPTSGGRAIRRPFLFALPIPESPARSPRRVEIKTAFLRGPAGFRIFLPSIANKYNRAVILLRAPFV
jgi:hypothetical protein